MAGTPILHRNEGQDRVRRAWLRRGWLRGGSSGILVLVSVAVTSCGTNQDAPAPPPAAPSGNLDLDVGLSVPSKDGVETPGFDVDSQYFIDHDKFPAVDSPLQASANEAAFLADDDPVLGFILAGKPRAYGVRALAYHHVVNDMIEDAPFAVAY